MNSEPDKRQIIRVGVVVPTLRHGGTEQVAARLSTLFVDHETIHVTIIVFDDHAPSYKPRGQVISINEPADLSQGHIARLARVLRRTRKINGLAKQHRFDILYALGDSANLAVAFTSAAPRRLISFRGYFSVTPLPSRRAQAIRRATITLLARRAHGIVPVSAGISHSLEHVYGLPPQKIHTIPTGYDTVEYARRRDLPRPSASELAPRYLVAVGTYKDEKRYDHLLRAFARAPLPTNVTLKVYGFNPEGQREELEELAHELGIHERVELNDFTSEPWRVVRLAEALLLSSEFEGFPNTLVEGMLCGVPVISTDCDTGPREILLDDVTSIPKKLTAYVEGDYGLLVPPPAARSTSDSPEAQRAHEAFAQAMSAIVNDAAEQAKWANLAIIGGERFSMERWESAHVALFQGLVQDS